MSRRQIFILMAIILIAAVAAYAYLHNRPEPLQEPTPGATSALPAEQATAFA